MQNKRADFIPIIKSVFDFRPDGTRYAVKRGPLASSRMQDAHEMYVQIMERCHKEIALDEVFGIILLCGAFWLVFVRIVLFAVEF